MKYKTVDVELRNRARAEWNKAVWWPVPLIALLLALFAWPAVRSWKKRERAIGVREDLARQLGLGASDEGGFGRTREARR